MPKMELEVLLSVKNFDIENLNKMNIKSSAIVINQNGKNDYKELNNYRIFSYNEKGLSVSRNRGLENAQGDIILLCDDDVVYNDDYEELIIEEFEENKKADVIVFNIKSPNRKIKLNKRDRRIHFYNVLRYTSTRIAFRRNAIEKVGINFNELFGAGAKYSTGEDTLFLVDCLKKRLAIFASKKNIATVFQDSSTWFNGYNEKFFFDKGALFTAINTRFRYFLMIQYLMRHKEVFTDINFSEAYKQMKKGSRDYLDGRK